MIHLQFLTFLANFTSNYATKCAYAFFYLRQQKKILRSLKPFHMITFCSWRGYEPQALVFPRRPDAPVSLEELPLAHQLPTSGRVPWFPLTGKVSVVQRLPFVRLCILSPRVAETAARGLQKVPVNQDISLHLDFFTFGLSSVVRTSFGFFP